MKQKLWHRLNPFYAGSATRCIGRLAMDAALIYGIGWGACNAVGNSVEYSHGERTGMINKVSEKGLIWETYEGQMALEGIVSGNGSSGANVWDFSLDRQAKHGENTGELVQKLRDYMRAGQKVKVEYIEQLSTWPWRSETDYLIQSVEPIEGQ
ncbi:MAG: hypothetical protein V1734_02695 [Nanoarchaeota archaeon]